MNRLLSVANDSVPRLFFAMLCCNIWLACQEDAIAQAPEPPPNYEQHVRPILLAQCGTCHNQQKRRGGLALDTYASAMEGGSGGEVIVPGDPENSRLWLLVSHEDEPSMPPDQDPIDKGQQQILRKWIAAGAIHQPGDKAKLPKPTLAYQGPAVESGQAIMPENVLCQPVTTSPRAAAVPALACSPVAPLLAVAGQQQVVLYHIFESKLLGILPFPGGNPQSLAFTPSGAALVVGGGHHAKAGWVQIFDVQTGDLLAKLGAEIDTVLASSANADLSLISLGGPSRMLRTFDFQGDLLRESKRHNNWVQAVTYSPDGKILGTADRNGDIMLWEGPTGRELHTLRGHQGAVHGLAWRADGAVITSVGEDGTLRFWNPKNGKQIRSVNAHDGPAQAVVVAPNGTVATCGGDKNVKLWSVEGKPVATLGQLADVGLAIGVDHTSSAFVAADWQGNITSWNSDGSDLSRYSPNPDPLDKQIVTVGTLLEEIAISRQTANEQLAQLTANLERVTDEYEVAIDNAQAARDELDRVTAELDRAEETDAHDQANQLAAARQEQEQAAQRLQSSSQECSELTAQTDLIESELAALVQLESSMLARQTALRQQQSRFESRADELRIRIQKAKIAAAKSRTQVVNAQRLLAKVKSVKQQISDTLVEIEEGDQSRTRLESFQTRAASEVVQFQRRLQDAQQREAESLGQLRQAEANARNFQEAYNRD